MIARGRLVGKRLTLLLVGAGEDDREEAATFSGTVRETEGGGLAFVRAGGETLALREEWLARIGKVPDEGRRWLLDSDYFLSLEVGALTDEGAPPDWIGIEVEFGGPGKPPPTAGPSSPPRRRRS